MAYLSTWRFARISPRKARLVSDLIRGKSADQALNLLKFSKKRAAVMVTKVLATAIADAGENKADMEDLYVSRSFCDAGPIVKRMQPKDRGKSYAIFKRTCHISVEVDIGAAELAALKKTKKKLPRAGARAGAAEKAA